MRIHTIGSVSENYLQQDNCKQNGSYNKNCLKKVWILTQLAGIHLGFQERSCSIFGPCKFGKNVPYMCNC